MRFNTDLSMHHDAVPKKRNLAIALTIANSPAQPFRVHSVGLFFCALCCGCSGGWVLWVLARFLALGVPADSLVPALGLMVAALPFIPIEVGGYLKKLVDTKFCFSYRLTIKQFGRHQKSSLRKGFSHFLTKIKKYSEKSRYFFSPHSKHWCVRFEKKVRCADSSHQSYRRKFHRFSV